MARARHAQVLDGRYVGRTGGYWSEIRVDLTADHSVSGDLEAAGAGRDSCYSFRSIDTVDHLDGSSIAVEVFDANGAMVEGEVTLEVDNEPGDGDAPSRVAGVLRVSDALSGIPAGTQVRLAGGWVGQALRELGLQVDAEEGVRAPDLFTQDGAEPPKRGSEQGDERAADSAELSRTPPTVGDCWREAGFDVQRLGPQQLPPIAPPRGGWSETDIFAQLNAQMEASAGVLDHPSWAVHVLLLSRTDRESLLGVMFDVDSGLPRQGMAVFVDTIRAAVGDEEFNRKFVQTTVHEIGHALNLTHRFGRPVRRSGSSSFMNYPWRFRGGGQVQEYWKHFAYAFDQDERRFLRHGPRSQLIPGGAAFGSAVYWQPDFSATAAAPGVPWNGLQLWLTPPPAGAVFAYGQPVFFEVSLRNVGGEPVEVPRFALDIKAGQLDLLVSRWQPGEAPVQDRLARSKPVTPVATRCFDLAEPAEGAAATSMIRLSPWSSMHSNVNLAYGSVAADMAQPGTYEVTPVLSFPAPATADGGRWAADSNGVDNVIVGRPLRFRVAPPASQREERDAELLYRRDVRVNLALGGSAALQEAADELEDLRLRRDRAAQFGPPDPVVPSLTRCAGIAAGRRGEVGLASRLLRDASTGTALTAFDPHTGEQTRRLARSYLDQTRLRTGTVVVVDLWSRATDADVRLGGRTAGFLVVQSPRPDMPQAAGGPAKQAGWGVLVPAGALPPEAMDDDAVEVSAAVTVSGEDGLAQRVTVSRIDLVSGQDETGAERPALALLQLSDAVPATPVPVDAPRSRSALTGGADQGSVFEFFGPTGSPAAETAGSQAADLQPYARAVDEALADAPEPIALADTSGPIVAPALAPPAAVHRYRGASLSDVGTFWCWITRRCETPPPQEDNQRYRLGGSGQLLGAGDGGDDATQRPSKTSYAKASKSGIQSEQRAE